MDGTESELRKYDLTFGHESVLDALLWSDPAMRRTAGFLSFLLSWFAIRVLLRVLVRETWNVRRLHKIRDIQQYLLGYNGQCLA
jgi:hypothetical protein